MKNEKPIEFKKSKFADSYYVMKNDTACGEITKLHDDEYSFVGFHRKFMLSERALHDILMFLTRRNSEILLTNYRKDTNEK